MNYIAHKVVKEAFKENLKRPSPGKKNLKGFQEEKEIASHIFSAPKIINGPPLRKSKEIFLSSLGIDPGTLALQV